MSETNDNALANSADDLAAINSYIEHNELDIKIGDEFIRGDSSSANIIRITGFKYEKEYPASKQEEVFVYYTSIANGSYSSRYKLSEFKPRDDGSANWYKLHAPFEQVKVEALAYLANPPKESENVTEEKGITLTSGTGAIKAADRQLRETKNRLKVIEKTVEIMIRGLSNQISELSKQIRYTSKILRLLETFMGVYEQITLIRDGEKAPIDTPISIRQLILYADEEVADITSYKGQMGIDYRRLDDFDAWVISDDNYMQLIPETKGVVAIKASRQQRDYGNIWDNVAGDSENKVVYLLIRNGEQLYRVATQLHMSDKLFPAIEDMERINKMLMSDKNYDEDDHFYSKDKANDEDLYWKQNAVLLQGLIMRTDVFQPTPFEISLFETKSYETGMLNLIRDAEPALADGRESFKEWRERLNMNIKKGTRIVMGHYSYHEAKDYLGSHFGGNFTRQYPELPHRGVYVIDESNITTREWDSDEYDKTSRDPFAKTGRKIHHVQHKNNMRFLYTPDDVIYDNTSWQGRKRLKRVAFYFDSDDRFFMNYDDASLEDVDYFLRNRMERKNYLEVMPMLIEIRAERMREQEFEAPLVDMIAAEFDCDKSIVWECILWWKMKTQIHRWIESDDAKAWRMIRRRVKRIVNGEILSDGESDD